MRTALIIFTKVPQKEKIKTRLNSLLSSDQILQIQIAMIKDCVEFAGHANYDKILFSITPQSAKNELKEKILINNEIIPESSFIYQKGDTFDSRFDQTVKDGFSIGGIKRLGIIGSDCPFIVPEIHNQLIKSLEGEKNIVFGWSKDGGVYAVGLSKTFGKIFNFQNKFTGGIESWLLIDEAKKHGLSIKSLPELTDIDTPEDLRHAYILCENLKRSGLIYPKYTYNAFNDIGLYVKDQKNNRSRKIGLKI